MLSVRELQCAPTSARHERENTRPGKKEDSPMFSASRQSGSFKPESLGLSAWFCISMGHTRPKARADRFLDPSPRYFSLISVKAPRAA